MQLCYTVILEHYCKMLCLQFLELLVYNRFGIEVFVVFVSKQSHAARHMSIMTLYLCVYRKSRTISVLACWVTSVKHHLASM